MALKDFDNSARKTESNSADASRADASRAAVNRATERHEREIARRAARDRQNAEPDDDYTPPALSLSGIRNGLIHSTISKLVMILLIVIFALGFFFLGNQPGSLPTNGRGNKSNAPDPIASAAGQPISRADFDYAVQQQTRLASFYGETPNPTNLLAMQQNVLQQLAGRAALSKAAKDAGIKASDDEVTARIEKEISDKIAADSAGNAAAARRMIEQQYGSEAKYREQLRINYDRDKVAQLLVEEKYEKQWQEKNRPTEAVFLQSMTKLNLGLISTRPQSPARTDKNPRAAFDKNKADAKSRIEKIAAQLKGLQGAALVSKFAELAKSGSEDVATKAKGGALGLVLPSTIQANETAKSAIQAATTFPALVGPLEDLETGVWNLYLVNSKKLELPKNFDKNKARLLKAFQDAGATQAWQKYAQDLSKTAEIQINDPALDAFKKQNWPLLTSSTGNGQQDVLQKYQDALAYAGGDEAAAIHFQRAQIFQGLKQPDKYVAELRAAVEAGGNTLPVRLELARALRGNKDSKGALEQLQAASKQLDDTPATTSMFGTNPNDALRAQLASEFQIAGRTDLATAERKKMTPTAAPGNPNTPGGRGNVITIPSGAAPSSAPKTALPKTAP